MDPKDHVSTVRSASPSLRDHLTVGIRWEMITTHSKDVQLATIFLVRLVYNPYFFVSRGENYYPSIV